MLQAFIYLVGYILIGLMVALIVNVLQIINAQTNNKEIISLQGPLAGILWPLTFIALIGYVFAVIFANGSELLTFKIIKLLKAK